MTVTEQEPEAVTYDESQLDELSTLLLQKVRSYAKEYNQNVPTIQAAKGDAQQLLESLRDTAESNDNEDVRNWTEVIDKLETKLFEANQARDALLKEQVSQIKQSSEGEANVLEEKNKELAKQYRVALPLLKKMIEEKLGKDAVTALIPTLAKGKGKGGGGAGGRRIRHRQWIVVTDKGEKTFDNASGAATALNLVTADLQKAFFEAAGGDQPEDWEETVSFTVGQHLIRSVANPPEEGSAPVTENDVDESDEDVDEDE